MGRRVNQKKKEGTAGIPKRLKIQLAIKRMFDVSVSLAILVLFLPLWCLAALAVRLTSPGPVFFVQERPGYGAKPFKILKFRTMYEGSGKMIKGKEVMPGDPRVTAVGRILRRSKIDEIPQLLNVLCGDMSLAGPRPERMESLVDYDREIAKRLRMLPGMTGLAQVSGNIYLSLASRYRLDVYYTEHFSLWLDMRIFIRTAGVMLAGEKRYLNKPLVKL